MKTREFLYAKEAAELIRIISLYKSLTCGQVFRLFPGKEEAIRNLLTRFIKQKRIVYNPNTGHISANEEYDGNPDSGMIAAFWVLLDFIDKADYHTASDYPVKISFFSDGELYEIVHVPHEQEIMMNHAMAAKEKEPPKRLIVVENPEQMSETDIPGAIAFCMVSPEGKVNYYKLE